MPSEEPTSTQPAPASGIGVQPTETETGGSIALDVSRVRALVGMPDVGQGQQTFVRHTPPADLPQLDTGLPVARDPLTPWESRESTPLETLSPAQDGIAASATIPSLEPVHDSAPPVETPREEDGLVSRHRSEPAMPPRDDWAVQVAKSMTQAAMLEPLPSSTPTVAQSIGQTTTLTPQMVQAPSTSDLQPGIESGTAPSAHGDQLSPIEPPPLTSVDALAPSDPGHTTGPKPHALSMDSLTLAVDADRDNAAPTVQDQSVGQDAAEQHNESVTRVDIPGVSHAQTLFPSLVPEQKRNSDSDRSSETNAIAESPSETSTTAREHEPDVTRHSEETITPVMPQQGKAGATTTAAKVSVPVPERHSPPQPAARPPNTALAAEAPVETSQVGASNEVRVTTRTVALPVTEGLPFRDHILAPEMPTRQTELPIGPYRREANHNADAASVQKLQARVDELTRRVAEQAAGGSPGTPAPAPSIIVVNRPARASGAPRAFWSRTYLSRAHLNMLR